MISDNEYRGFVCLLIVVFVGFFLILLVGVAALFTVTIDDDGSLWHLLELHGYKKI